MLWINKSPNFIKRLWVLRHTFWNFPCLPYHFSICLYNTSMSVSNERVVASLVFPDRHTTKHMHVTFCIPKNLSELSKLHVDITLSRFSFLFYLSVFCLFICFWLGSWSLQLVNCLRQLQCLLIAADCFIKMVSDRVFFFSPPNEKIVSWV